MIWGTTITPGNEYALVFKEELHLSLATLESREEYGSLSGSPCHLILTTKRTNYLLCTLLNRVVYQQTLDLTLMPNEKVTFKCQGETNIHLTGYTRKESTNKDQRGSLDERVERTANASLGEQTAEDASTSDLPVGEVRSIFKVTHETTNAVYIADCGEEKDTVTLDGCHESDSVRKTSDADSDITPVSGQIKEESRNGKLFNIDTRNTEVFLKCSDVQDENILARAFRDCIMENDEVTNSGHSDVNSFISRKSEPFKECREKVRKTAFVKVPYKDVQNQTEDYHGTPLTGRGIKTEKEDLVEENTFQERDNGTGGKNIRNMVELAEVEHEVLHGTNSASVTGNTENMGSVMTGQTKNKGDKSSKSVSVLGNVDHDSVEIESVRSISPQVLPIDTDFKRESTHMMKSSGYEKLEGKWNIPSVVDGNGTCENNSILVEHYEGRPETRDTGKLDSFVVQGSKDNAALDAGDFNLSMKREEGTIDSCAELPELELVDLLPEIDDIIIKEEIDLENTKDLEDMEIMLLDAFRGESIRETQDLIIKKEDLNFEGFLKQCAEGAQSVSNNPHKITGTWDNIKQRKVPDVTDFNQMNQRLDALEKMLHMYTSGPIDFKLDVPNLHPEEQQLARPDNETNIEKDALGRIQLDIESGSSGALDQNRSIQDVFTEKVKNLKVTLSRQEVRKAMSGPPVVKEEEQEEQDDADDQTEDETDASRSEVSEDETDWEAIVESRSERDTKKRKSKTKAKEVTAKLLKEIGDVCESDDECQKELSQHQEDGAREEQADNTEETTRSEQNNMQYPIGKHFRGERALNSKFNKKRKQRRTGNSSTSGSDKSNTEKYNKRKDILGHDDDESPPKRKKFCLPVKLSLMQNVKTPRHRRRITHSRLKCKYCTKSYLYTGSLRRHENGHRECHRPSIQGRPGGDGLRKLRLQKLLPGVPTSKRSCKNYSQKKESDTPKETDVHDLKHENSRDGSLTTDNTLRTKETQKTLDMDCKGSEALHRSKLSKSSRQLKTQDNGHAPSRPFQCTFCPKTFIHEGSLRSHEISHDERTFKCSKCEKGFSKPDQLEKHEMFKHGKDRPIFCPICKKRFTTSSDCDIHYQKSHLNSKISEDTPEKISTDSPKTKSSKSTSEKVLPHRCKSCGKRFRMQSGLEQHECVEKTTEGFSCRYCKKSFRMFDNCRRHEGKHKKDNSIGDQTGDSALRHVESKNKSTRPFKCHFCSKSFSLIAVRNSHEKEHAKGKETMDHFHNKNAEQINKKIISHLESKVATFNES